MCTAHMKLLTRKVHSVSSILAEQLTALLVHLCVKKECVQADYQAIISPISFTGRQGE